MAADANISPKYLATVWSILTEPCHEPGPIAAVQLLWRELSPPVPGEGSAREDAARAGCERMRDFVVELRRRLTPKVPNLTVPGMDIGAQPLLLWKDRQFVANRRRYAGGLDALVANPLKTGTAEARALAVPAKKEDVEQFEPDYPRFCSTFPDAFLVSERGRVFLDEEEKQNVGRYLSGLSQPDGLLPGRRAALRADTRRGRPAQARRALARIRLRHECPDPAALGLHLERADRAAGVHGDSRV